MNEAVLKKRLLHEPQLNSLEDQEDYGGNKRNQEFR
jgi:hypothetical protein